MFLLLFGGKKKEREKKTKKTKRKMKGTSLGLVTPEMYSAGGGTVCGRVSVRLSSCACVSVSVFSCVCVCVSIHGLKKKKKDSERRREEKKYLFQTEFIPDSYHF